LLLDGLATRYHLLPSEVLERGDTLDVLVMDVSMTWLDQEMEKKRAVSEGRAPIPKKMSTETLQAMLDKVRKKNENQADQG
jgi:hypothetical protein